jgi:pimeloyl-ACP methyl ester carboxylesterase
MDPEIFHSPLGPIEYSVRGQGSPLLISHGAAGGFDQALVLTEPLAGRDVQRLALSRDGYMGSPLGREASPRAQAEKYIGLLDHLGVGRCAILGVSAGGPSAIEFAIRYPDRCSRLILVSAIVAPVRPAYLSLLPERLLLALLRSSLYRAARVRASDSLLLKAFGVSREDERRLALDHQGRRALTAVLQAARDPEGGRIRGTLNDIGVSRRLPTFPFAALRPPTLAIHGTRDSFAPIGLVAGAAAVIPDCRFEPIDGAGHLCIVTHRQQVFPMVLAFLQAD